MSYLSEDFVDDVHVFTAAVQYASHDVVLAAGGAAAAIVARDAAGGVLLRVVAQRARVAARHRRLSALRRRRRRVVRRVLPALLVARTETKRSSVLPHLIVLSLTAL